MGKRKGPEQTRPLREAWDELHEEYLTVVVRVVEVEGSQAGRASGAGVD
jgi:hypothetical protein